MNIIKRWLLKRKLESLNHVENKLEEFFNNDGGLIWREKEIEKMLVLFIEEMDIFQLLFRVQLTKDEQTLIIGFTEEIERLKRIYNSKDSLEEIKKCGLSKEILKAEIIKIKNIIKRIKIESNNFKSLKIPENTTRESKLGVWDTTIVCLIERLNQIYGKEYVIVGGLAIQLWVNSLIGNPKNKDYLKKSCRATHDVDIIFPEGYDFSSLIDKLNFDGELDGILVQINLERKGKKKPEVKIDVISNDEIESSYIILNISNSYKESKNSTKEHYNKTIKDAVLLDFSLNHHKFQFKTASIESIVIGKAQRASEKDLYDIKLILNKVEENQINIDLDYIRSNLKPELFYFLVSKTAA